MMASPVFSELWPTILSIVSKKRAAAPSAPLHQFQQNKIKRLLVFGRWTEENSKVERIGSCLFHVALAVSARVRILVLDYIHKTLLVGPQPLDMPAIQMAFTRENGKDWSQHIAPWMERQF